MERMIPVRTHDMPHMPRLQGVAHLGCLPEASRHVGRRLRGLLSGTLAGLAGSLAVVAGQSRPASIAVARTGARCHDRTPSMRPAVQMKLTISLAEHRQAGARPRAFYACDA